MLVQVSHIVVFTLLQLTDVQCVLDDCNILSFETLIGFLMKM